MPLVALAALVVSYHAWRWLTVPPDAIVVGLSLDTAWHSRIGITNATYEAALARVDAKVYRIRPETGAVDDVLDRIDALLLSGGGDIAPDLYGGDEKAAVLVDRERDLYEIALIEGARKRGMPILGICRGIQILNVAHGGTIRHLRSDEALNGVHGVHLDSLRAHEVTIEPDSGVARITGSGKRTVNSFHGQAVGRVGDGWRVVATGPDGVIEAIEATAGPFAIGIQWHPEILSLTDSDKLAIFEALVREASEYRTRRAAARPE